jgi:2'-5' RNA ligase
MQRPQTALAPPKAPSTGEILRLFVAIAPPPGVLDELDALAAPLRTTRDDLRWTSREAWHVTLAFLGEVEETALAGLVPRLERAARNHHQIQLAFAGAGAFPAPDRANVLWSGLSGDRLALADLAAVVRTGASRAGATPPDKGRHFQPHLTLARCRLPADVSGIVAGLAGYQGQAWNADCIHLVRSDLGSRSNLSGRGPLGGPAKPRYSSVARWPLRSPETAPTTTG